MSNSHQPYLGARALIAPALKCGKGVGAEGVVPATHVDGDYLANIVGLHLPLDVSPVDLLAQAGDLIPRAVWRGGAYRLSGRRWRLARGLSSALWREVVAGEIEVIGSKESA